MAVAASSGPVVIDLDSDSDSEDSFPRPRTGGVRRCARDTALQDLSRPTQFRNIDRNQAPLTLLEGEVAPSHPTRLGAVPAPVVPYASAITRLPKAGLTHQRHSERYKPDTLSITSDNNVFHRRSGFEGDLSPEQLTQFTSDTDQQVYSIEDSPYFSDASTADEKNMNGPQSNLQSYDEVLATIIQVLPDICHNHVQTTYDKYRTSNPSINAELLLSVILSEDSYPKRKKSLKRKRENEEDDEDEKGLEILKMELSPGQIQPANTILQNQFVSFRAGYIESILKVKKTIYQTIITLKKIGQNQNTTGGHYKPLAHPRRRIVKVDYRGDDLLRKMFEAAQNKITKDREMEEARKRQAEEDERATRRAFDLKDISECQCCFETCPNSKMVVCDGTTAHAFCFECMTGHVTAQLDLQKHDIRCMDSSSCSAAFSHRSKKKALDRKLFARLERVQQQNELRDAGLPLTHCPFCDFAAICPDVNEDRELRCQGPDCGLTSCRLCQQVSHLPLTCEEYKREQGVDQRHQIEEEMTNAFLRKCHKCKIPIVKDGGCNKITCSRCHSHICDVCGKDITKEGYAHFSKSKCPQSDDLSEAGRAAARVKAAEMAARQQVLAENPELSAKDLEIKLSAVVAEDERAKLVKPNGVHQEMAGIVRAARHERNPAALRGIRARRFAAIDPAIARDRRNAQRYYELDAQLAANLRARSEAEQAPRATSARYRQLPGVTDLHAPNDAQQVNPALYDGGNHLSALSPDYYANIYGHEPPVGYRQAVDRGPVYYMPPQPNPTNIAITNQPAVQMQNNMPMYITPHLYINGGYQQHNNLPHMGGVIWPALVGNNALPQLPITQANQHPLPLGIGALQQQRDMLQANMNYREQVHRGYGGI